MLRNARCAALLFLGVLFPVLAADLTVSPQGDDGNPGTPDRPLRTLAAARNRLRPQLAAMDQDLVVDVLPGQYLLAEPLAFGPEDSARNGHRVVYRGPLGATAELLGGVPVTDWRLGDDGNWHAHSPVPRFQQLFLGGVRQTKARQPNQGYYEVETYGKPNTTTEFGYAAGDLPPGPYGPEAQVYIWAGYDWFTDTCPIRDIILAQRAIVLDRPTLVPIDRKRPHRRYFFQGFRSALDTEGEFFLDEATGEILLRTTRDPNREGVLVPVLPSVIELRGTDEAHPVQGLTFENLTVGVTAFPAWFDEIRGENGNSTWNEPFHTAGAIHFANTTGCAVRFCRIQNTGLSGVSLLGTCVGNELYGNEIRDAGYHAILVKGIPPRLDPRPEQLSQGNRIANNHLFRCGRLVGHGAGVFLHSAASNQVVHNLIHQMPRYGICAKGGTPNVPKGTPYEATIAVNPLRDNVFSDNDIHHVNLDSEDSGFISFHTTGTGNVVDHNLLHDGERELGGLAMGIYLDDGAGYFRVTRNWIWNIGGGSPGRCMPIYTKGIYNLIDSNVLVGEERTGAACTVAYMFGRRADHHTWTHNIVYLRGADSVVWRNQNWIEDRYVECDRNLFWNTTGPVRFGVERETLDLAGWQAFKGLGLDRHSVVADPGFADPATGDFRLREGSPAREIGFEPMDATTCGLLPDYPFPLTDEVP